MKIENDFLKFKADLVIETFLFVGIKKVIFFYGLIEMVNCRVRWWCDIGNCK